MDKSSWKSSLYFSGQIGEDGEVFENVCETDCEGVHSNIHYTVHEEGLFKVMMRT